MGCRMDRVCHLGSCPVGIATQNPELRKKFTGKSEYVERFMLFIADQLREIMANLGARTVEELVGRTDLLKAKEDAPIDLSSIIGFARNTHCRPDCAYDLHLEDRADKHNTTELDTTDRAFGTTLREDVSMEVYGFGGQAFGAFLNHGQHITLHGEANDYLGKGLSGGKLAVCPDDYEKWNPDDVLIGNVALYGATSGEAYVAGQAGERFCVRNSGATAVVEGIGDHGCEYMTGGRVVILGPVGDNFAAGMSGGYAYVLDEQGTLHKHLNLGMVEMETVPPHRSVELFNIITAHYEATGSPRASEILKHFVDLIPHFKLIIPTEYKKHLAGC